MNKTTVLGHIGADATINQVPSQPEKEVINFTIATTTLSKDKEITTWFHVSLWVNKGGGKVTEYLVKGKQVLVEGRVFAEAYVNKEGKPTPVLKISAYDVFLC